MTAVKTQGFSSEIDDSAYPIALNDAHVLGKISEKAIALDLSLGQGKNRQDKKWPAKVMTYAQLIQGLSKHGVGSKDGAAFLQGTAIGNERKANAIDQLFIMGLDVDSGVHPEAVIEKLTALGLSAIVYTTHSHLKRETFLLENSYNQFTKRNKLDSEISHENVKRFLIEARSWEQWIADTVTLGERTQTPEGMGYWLHHDPMPKFRVVFPLAEPFVIAKQRMSQSDAIKLWKSKLVGLARSLSLPIDESCLDPSRLFYLPRHDKNAKFGVWVTGGAPLDFDAIPEGKVKGRVSQDQTSDDVFAQAGAELAAREGLTLVNGFSLKKWAREDAQRFDICAMFRAVAPEKIRNDQNTTKLTVECPFDHNHSSAGDTKDAGCYVQSPEPEIGVNSFVFACSHNSCKGHDRLSMIAEAIDHGWFTTDDLSNEDYSLFSLDDDKPAEEIEGGVTFDSASDAIAALNKFCAVVQIGAKTSYLVNQERGEEMNFKSKEAAADWLANWRIAVDDGKGNTKFIPAFDVWLKATKRRQFNKVVFHPAGTRNPKHYNTWTGFSTTPKEGAWPLLKRHLFEVWCGCDPDLFEYTLAWFAQMFQQPEVKPGVALFIVGKKGTGKGVVKRVLRRILGTHLTVLTAKGELSDKNNSWLANALLVVCEETIFAGDRSAIGPVRALITETNVSVQEKFVARFNLDVYARIIAFSNEKRAIPAEGEDERRFFGQEASDVHKGDIEYFEALIAEMDNGGTEAFLHDMMHFDFRRVELRNPPKTKALADQIEANLTAPNKWWNGVLTDGVFNTDDDESLTQAWETQAVEISRALVQDSYNAAVTTYGMKKEDAAAIGKFLHEVCPGMKTKQKKDGGKRFYVFPPLPDCRKAFENVAGVRFEVEESSQVNEGQAQKVPADVAADVFYQAGVSLSLDPTIEAVFAKRSIDGDHLADIVSGEEQRAGTECPYIGALERRAFRFFDSWLSHQDDATRERIAALDLTAKRTGAIRLAEWVASAPVASF